MIDRSIMCSFADNAEPVSDARPLARAPQRDAAADERRAAPAGREEAARRRGAAATAAGRYQDSQAASARRSRSGDVFRLPKRQRAVPTRDAEQLR